MKGLTERFLQGDKAALQLLHSQGVVASYLSPSADPSCLNVWVAEYDVGGSHYVELVEKDSPRIRGLYANFILGDLADILPLDIQYVAKDGNGVWWGTDLPPEISDAGIVSNRKGKLLNLNAFVRSDKLPKGAPRVVYSLGSKNVAAPLVTNVGVEHTGAEHTGAERTGWRPLEEPTERLTEELDELKEEDDRWETFIGGPLDGQKVLGWESVGTLIFQLGGQRGYYGANLKWHSQPKG